MSDARLGSVAKGVAHKPSESPQSDEECNLLAVNLRLLAWPLAVFAAYLLLLAALGVFYPVIRSEMFDILTFTFGSFFIVLAISLQARLTSPWAQIIAWTLLGIAIVPQLVLLVIFGFPKMWPPH